MMEFNFTKDQAITEHRKMWRWIYDETVKQKRPVSKEEYLEKNNIFGLYCNCFLCEYSIDERIKNAPSNIIFKNAKEADIYVCGCCPLDWDSKVKNECPCTWKVDFEPKTYIGFKIIEKLFAGYYYRWKGAFRKGDYKEAAKYAYKIANLKEKKK